MIGMNNALYFGGSPLIGAVLFLLLGIGNAVVPWFGRRTPERRIERVGRWMAAVSSLLLVPFFWVTDERALAWARIPVAVLAVAFALFVVAAVVRGREKVRAAD